MTCADCQRHALYGKAFGDLQAYAPGCPGDQRRFSCLVHCAVPFTALRFASRVGCFAPEQRCSAVGRSDAGLVKDAGELVRAVTETPR